MDPRSPFHYEAMNRIFHERFKRTYSYQGEPWTVPLGPMSEPFERLIRIDAEGAARARNRERVARMSGPYPTQSSADFVTVSGGLPGLGRRS